MFAICIQRALHVVLCVRQRVHYGKSVTCCILCTAACSVYKGHHLLYCVYGSMFIIQRASLAVLCVQQRVQYTKSIICCIVCTAACSVYKGHYMLYCMYGSVFNALICEQ